MQPVSDKKKSSTLSQAENRDLIRISLNIKKSLYEHDTRRSFNSSKDSRDSTSSRPQTPASPAKSIANSSGRNSKHEARMERENSSLIDEMIKEEKKKMAVYKSEPKVLILGSSDSGKSTVFKQFKILHANGFTDKERETSKHQIFKNLLIAIITLMALCDESFNTMNNTISDTPNDNVQSLISQSAFEVDEFVGSYLSMQGGSLVESTEDDPDHHSSSILKKYNQIMVFGDKFLKTVITNLPTDIKIYMKKAFQEEAVLKLLAQGYNIHKLPDTTSYFCQKDNLDRILQSDYSPTNEDILHIRIVTQTVSKISIKSKNSENGKIIHVFDVSGLKGHRKAWLPYFDDCNSILFIVALSSFDQNLFEDVTVNRLYDALVLFEQTTANPLLANSDFILFLNKKDLFAKKASKTKLSTFFPEYKGPNYHANEYCDFLKKKFQSSFKSKRQLVTHVTCATDTKQVSVVIQAVIKSMIRNELTDAGFI